MKLECITRHFYDELDQGRIVGRKCPVCGNIEFPPHPACNACGNLETEWVELSGKGVVTGLILASGMPNKRMDILRPCAFGVIELEEGGDEFNAVVRGVTEEKEPELQKKLPLPVKAAIVQREGYKSVVFDIVTE